MKQLKKLTRNQKIILDKLGYESKKFALVSDDKDSFVVGKKEYPGVQMRIAYGSLKTRKH